jgi:hypothetical protein
MLAMRKSNKIRSLSGGMHHTMISSQAHEAAEMAGGVAETLTKSGKGFKQDTFCFTVVAALALVACCFGKAGFLALIFAAFFIVAIPILRRFGLIDTSQSS